MDEKNGVIEPGQADIQHAVERVFVEVLTFVILFSLSSLFFSSVYCGYLCSTLTVVPPLLLLIPCRFGDVGDWFELCLPFELCSTFECLVADQQFLSPDDDR